MSNRDYKPTPLTPEELEAQQTQRRINKTQETRTFQAAAQAIRKIKVPSREIGFFKPTAVLAKRPTTTPLNAFVPDAIPITSFLIVQEILIPLIQMYKNMFKHELINMTVHDKHQFKYNTTIHHHVSVTFLYLIIMHN